MKTDNDASFEFTVLFVEDEHVRDRRPVGAEALIVPKQTDRELARTVEDTVLGRKNRLGPGLLHEPSAPDEKHNDPLGH